jgi:hypothetical protein
VLFFSYLLTFGNQCLFVDKFPKVPKEGREEGGTGLTLINCVLLALQGQWALRAQDTVGYERSGARMSVMKVAEP